MEGAQKAQENFKNQIQEFCQREHVPLRKYKLKRFGPDHKPTFSAAVLIGNTSYVGSQKPTKKEAEQSAAKVAVIDLLCLNNEAEELKKLQKEKETWMKERRASVEQRTMLQEHLRIVGRERSVLAER